MKTTNNNTNRKTFAVGGESNNMPCLINEVSGRFWWQKNNLCT